MRNTKARILKNTGAYILVGIIPYLTSFIMLPIYTRYMSPEDYGILALVNAFQAILVAVVSLQLNAALPRYYFEYSSDELKIFFSTTMYSVAGIAATFVMAIHFVGNPLIGLIFPKADIPYFPYFFISLVSVFVAQLSQVAQKLLVVQERGGSVLFRSVLGTIFGIAAGLYFVVYLDMKALGALLAGVLGGFFVMVLNILLVKEFFVLKWRKKYFVQSLKYGWPIIPHAMGGYLFMYSDKIVMEKFLALSAIGLYSIADRFAMILKLFVNSINNALSPNFMRLAKQSEKSVVLKWKRLITKWSVLISLAYLALAFFSEEVIMILTPPRYHAAYPIVPILLIAYIFRWLYCFSSAPLFYRKATKYIPLITFSAGVLNVVGNIFLIPAIGVYGAACTTVLSFFVTFILAEYFSKFCFSMQYEWTKLAQIFVPMFFCAGSILFIGGFSFHAKLIVKVILFSCYFMFVWFMNFADFKSDFFDISYVIKKRLGFAQK